MTGGFGYDLSSSSILKIKEQSNGRCPTQDVIRALAKEPLLFQPGTRFNCSLCHDILGAVIEVTSGLALGQYMKQHIFDPCNMKNTTFCRSPDQDMLFCPEYIYDTESNSIARMRKLYNPYVLGSEYESGGAGLISSVDDYSKFQEALISGKLIQPETLALMRQPHLSEQELLGYQYSFNDLFIYGLGVSVPSPGKGSPIHFGWGGRAGALTLLDPDHQITMFYAQHVLDSSKTEAEKFREKIKSAVYRDLGFTWAPKAALLCEGR